MIYWAAAKGQTMRITSATAAVAMVACGLLCPAVAAADSAQDAITDLRRQGYNVVIDRVGTGPLENCVVTDIRNPTRINRMRIALEREDPTPKRQIITVSLDCSR